MTATMALTTLGVFLILLGNCQTNGKGVDTRRQKIGGFQRCPEGGGSEACYRGGIVNCMCDSSTGTYRKPCSYIWPTCRPLNQDVDCDRFRNCRYCNPMHLDSSIPPCTDCAPGWTNSGYCDKDDPCYPDNGRCEHTCKETPSFDKECGCRPGYKLMRDQHKCLYLSCLAPGEIDNGHVTSTGNWALDTYAKFECEDPRAVLGGPYATKCVENVAEEELHWSEDNPKCKDSCDEVEENRRTACYGNGGAGREKCQQLGCCYQESSNTTVPPCYLDPSLFFLRFDGYKPETYTPDVTLHERHTDSCALETVTTYGRKIYVITKQGLASGTVALQTCEPLSGRMKDYTLKADPNASTFQYMETSAQVVTSSDGKVQVEVPYETVTGVPSAVFTQYPKMRSFISPRLVVRLSSDVRTPVDNPTCVENCYRKCDVLTAVSTSGNVTTVHSMHINLAHVKNYVTQSTRRLVLNVHTVVINRDVDLPVPTFIQADEMITDLRYKSYINLPKDGILGDAHETQVSSARMKSMKRECNKM